MTLPIDIPRGFSRGPSGFRSGLAARYTIPLNLDDQQRFLYAGFRHTTTHLTQKSRDSGLEEADVADPLQFHLYVPPFTKLVQWRVLTRKLGSVSAETPASVLRSRISVTTEPESIPGDPGHVDGAVWRASEAVRPGVTDQPAHLIVEAATPAEEAEWRTVMVKAWLTGDVELFAIEFEPLRLEVSGDAILV